MSSTLRNAISLGVVCWLFVPLFTTAGLAQRAHNERAVEVGKKALKSRFPWYDADTDQPRRIDVEPQSDLKNRHSRWEYQRPNWSLPPWLIPFGQIVLAIVAVALLAILVYYLVRTYSEPHSTATSRATRQATGRADRSASLPFQVDRPDASFVEEARRHYEAGRFDQAIVYLYSYQLIELDKHQVIRLTKGKTNRQYLREIRCRPGLAELLEITMVAFEDVFFGRQRLERRRFESCWSQLDQFHEQLRQVA